MAKDLNINEEKNILGAAERRALRTAFYALASKLVMLSVSIESVDSICREKIENASKKNLREKDGYIYAAKTMSDEIKSAIEKDIADRRLEYWDEYEKAEKEAELKPQSSRAPGSMMGYVVPVSKQQPFKILEKEPDLECGGAFSADDMVYIIGMNEMPKPQKIEVNADGKREPVYKRLHSPNIEVMKKKTFRVLKEIAERYEDEVKLVRAEGPREAYIYHGSFFRLVARYMEEQALQKRLYPPHGSSSPQYAELIIDEWNNLKKELFENRNQPPQNLIVPHLEKLHFFDYEINYDEEKAIEMEEKKRANASRKKRQQSEPGVEIE